MKTLILAIMACGLLLSSSARAEGDAARGEKLYGKKCVMCHALDQNRVGPKSTGVYGRKAGTVADFNAYSSGLKALGLTWDEASLDKWLTEPSAMAPGSKMTFRLEAPQDRADVIAYLKTLK